MPITHIETQTNKKSSSPQQHRPQNRSPVTVAHNPAAIIQRAWAAPTSLSRADVLQLQRTIGNRAVGRLLTEIGKIPSTGQQAPVQRQAPEEEEELMQGKFDPIQRQGGELEDEELLQGKFDTIQQQEPEEEELLQGKFTGECIQYQAPEEEELMQGKFASGLTGTLQAKEESPPNKTGMPDNLKSGLENISGMNLSGVRVQYNSSKPKQLNALAYTRGQEIHVGPSQEKHLPHEGWHVVQQMQGRVKPTMQAKGVAINDDVVLEHEADVMGKKALQIRRTYAGASGEAVQRAGKASEVQGEVIGGSGEKILLNFPSIAHELTHVVQQNGYALSRKSINTANLPIVQRALGDDIDWDVAGSIKRSGEGAEGVIFVTTSAGEIVVKFLKAAAGAEQADKTLKATGFTVPNSRIVKNNDDDLIGGQIRALINSKKSQLEEVQKEQVTKQMDTYTYIQLQKKATGVPLDKLNTNQIEAFIGNAALIQEVGKLAAVDAFTGNTDRLSRSTVNTGNYILADGPEGSTLIAIDNELNAQKASSKTAREKEVRFVISEDGAADLASSFLLRLTGSGVKYMFSEDEEHFVKTNMRLGVIAGAKAVIDLMESQPQFINQAKEMEKTQLPGPQGTGTSNREIVRKTLKARLEAIKDQYIKNGWNKLGMV